MKDMGEVGVKGSEEIKLSASESSPLHVTYYDMILDYLIN
jgi:hypothetical protein